MSKERLTEKCWRNLDPWECCGQDSYCKRGCRDKGGCANGCIVPKLYSQLAEYEDLEEQGLLLRLPVAVGSKVYEIIEETVPEHYYYIAEYEVQDISAKAVMYADDWCSFDYPNLYFGRAEAEEKLRELEGAHEI